METQRSMVLSYLRGATLLLYYVLKKLSLLLRKKALPPTFLEIAKEFLANEVRENSLTKSTEQKYDKFYRNLEGFLKSCGREQIRPADVDIKLMVNFRSWLHKNLKSCCQTHSAKHIETCKRIVDYTVINGWAPGNPIRSLSSKRDRLTEIIHLETDELWLWVSHDYQNETYRKVQLLSIFQAATGISYANLFDYKTTFSPNSGLWIEDNRKKVGHKPFYVPLDAPEFEIAKTIHEIFDGQLPSMTNGAYNRILKEMAAILEIKKRLTTHVFRKTFATMMSYDGFSAAIIAGVLGNTEQVARTRYINESKQKIERAFRERRQTELIRVSLAN